VELEDGRKKIDGTLERWNTEHFRSFKIVEIVSEKRGFEFKTLLTQY
jgi:hypothetical protein